MAENDAELEIKVGQLLRDTDSGAAVVVKKIAYNSVTVGLLGMIAKQPYRKSSLQEWLNIGRLEIVGGNSD